MSSPAWSLTDEEFLSVYGPWRTRTPDDVRELMRGYDGIWFIAGGWAIEAFTGVSRPHDDCDASVLRSQFDAFRRHVRGDYDVWAASAGALKPIFPGQPGTFDDLAPKGSGQVWLRPGWDKPWEYDVLLAPGDPQTWVYKRDESIRMPMAHALWEKDGIRYLRPHIQLLYKARGLRSKDQADFEATWPLLERPERDWLLSALRRTLPDHPWLVSIRLA